MSASKRSISGFERQSGITIEMVERALRDIDSRVGLSKRLWGLAEQVFNGLRFILISLKTNKFCKFIAYLK